VCVSGGGVDLGVYRVWGGLREKMREGFGEGGAVLRSCANSQQLRVVNATWMSREQKHDRYAYIFRTYGRMQIGWLRQRIVRLFLSLKNSDVPQLCPGDLWSAPGNNMVLIIHLVKILTRLELKWRKLETFSRFCANLSALSCKFIHYTQEVDRVRQRDWILFIIVYTCDVGLHSCKQPKMRQTRLYIHTR